MYRSRFRGRALLLALLSMLLLATTVVVDSGQSVDTSEVALVDDPVVPESMGIESSGAVDLGVGGPTVPTTAPIAIPTTAPVLMPEEPSVPDPLASIADLHDEVLLSQDTLLYRVYGGEAGPIGGYWSRTAPSGPMQAKVDSALNPAWGNLATDVSTIRVPAGTTIYEGAAAAQPLTGGGSLLGGGNQVFIPRVDSAWLVGG